MCIRDRGRGQANASCQRTQAAADLERYYKIQEKLEQEIRELQNGSLTAQLEAQKEELTAKQQEQNRKVGMLQAEMIEHIRVQGSIESDVKKYEENLAVLSEGFVENEELAAEVSEQLLSLIHIFMDLPSNFGCWKYSGMSFTSTESMWFGRMSLVISNQNLDICVRTVPFFVTSLCRITSKQLMRSVATMIRLSPLS